MIVIKVLQLHMHTANAAHSTLEQRVKDEDVHICILSEVNKNKSTNKAKHEQGWIAEESGDTAIWWTGRNRQVKVEDIRRGRGFTRVTLTGGLQIMSCYSSPNDNIDNGFVNCLDDIAQQINQNRHDSWLIAGDFNAWSTEWGSASTTRRGRELEDLMSKCGLFAMNDGNTPTFRSRERMSFVDVTLVSRPDIIHDWKVNEDVESNSDHQYIEYSIHTESYNAYQEKTRSGWRWKNFDLDKFYDIIDDTSKKMENNELEIDSDSINALLQEACSAATPRNSKWEKRTPV